jgi:CubicO group peptidase (beta-lactamase class C family)
VYDALVGDAPSLVSEDVLREATAEASAGEDLVLGRQSRFGLGFQLTQPERPLGPNPRSFGHFGTGGALGFADPDAGVAFGYVMNRGGPQWQDPRNRALIDAVYAALSAGG